MRKIPTLDSATISQFKLNTSEARCTRKLLASMGIDAAAATCQLALSMPEACVNAALWVALHASLPWPWLGAELELGMRKLSEEFEGCKLFCALLARAATPDHPPQHVPPSTLQALETLGIHAASVLCDPTDLAGLSSHRIFNLSRQLLLPSPPPLNVHNVPRISPSGLGLWALPFLYTPKRFGSYSEMSSVDRALLAVSCADLVQQTFPPQSLIAPSAFLGAGPFWSILDQAPLLSAPLTLKIKITLLCQSMHLRPDQLACSVSFHHDPNQEWMRVALRPVETGFCLDGFDWPAPDQSLDIQFGRLLEALEDNNIQWCHQVDGTFDALLCPICSQAIYPNPAHEPWTRFCLEAGAPPDGSHLHA